WATQSTTFMWPPSNSLRSSRLLIAAARAGRRARLDNDVTVLYSDRIRPHGFRWLRNRTAAGDVELPSVPGTAYNLSLPHPYHAIRADVLCRPRDFTQTERPTRMRTAVVQCVVLPVDVEYAYFEATDLNQPAAARRKVRHATYDVPAQD